MRRSLLLLCITLQTPWAGFAVKGSWPAPPIRVLQQLANSTPDGTVQPVSFTGLAGASSGTPHLQLRQRHYKRHIRPSMLLPAEQLQQPLQPNLLLTPGPVSAVAPLASARLASVQVAAAGPAASNAAAVQFSQAPATATNQKPGSSQTCGPLTADKVAAAAVNFTVLLMVTDASTAPALLHHWLGNVVAAGIKYHMIAATDEATDAALVTLGLAARCYRLVGTTHRVASTGYTWASHTWKEATWRKVTAVLELLILGYNVILSDIDVMWLADPLNYLLNEPQADFLISLDAHYTNKRVGDPGLENNFNMGKLMNTGVYFARARLHVTNMFQQWISMRRAHNHDQEAFKALAATAGPVVHLNGTTRLGKVFGATVVMGHLPLSSFLHSYSYSIMKLHKLMNTTAYEVHMVFGYGTGHESKVYKLRDAGLGFDPLDSEYYHPPGGLLSFDMVAPDVPVGYSGWNTEDLSYTEDDMELKHNQAIDFQLQQLYHAMGLALALNRTLLMPNLTCFCTRGWFPNEACRLPGDQRSTLPFTCPGDQVFNIEALMNPSSSVAGVMLRVRPPGFAADRRLNQSISEGRLTVTPGEPSCTPTVRHSIWRHLASSATRLLAEIQPGPNCVDEKLLPDRKGPDGSNEQQLNKQLVVPIGHAGEVMAKLLADYSSIPWLHFTNVTAAFAGFKHHASHEEFKQLLSSVVAEWCCRGADRVARAGVPDGHLHQIRPWGSSQRMCAKRVSNGGAWDKVHSFFC